MNEHPKDILRQCRIRTAAHLIATKGHCIELHNSCRKCGLFYWEFCASNAGAQGRQLAAIKFLQAFSNEEIFEALL